MSSNEAALLGRAIGALSFVPYRPTTGIGDFRVDALAVRGHNDRPGFFAAYGIWLTFWESATDPRSRVQVGTFDGASMPGLTGDVGSLSSRSCAAFHAACALLEFNRPAMAGDTPYVAEPAHGLYKALARHGTEIAHFYSQWRPLDRIVDDTPTAASVWTFAGAWAALLSRGMCEIVVVGSGDPPPTLALVPVPVSTMTTQRSDAEDVRGLARAVRVAAYPRLGAEAAMLHGSLHPDEQRVLDGQQS
jgi:hypothetical protein